MHIAQIIKTTKPMGFENDLGLTAPDRKTGEPKVGSYYQDSNVDAGKLGFDIEGRKVIELEVGKPTNALKSKAANIEDWNDSDKVFSGGETQLFNPKIDFSSTGWTK